MYYDEKLQQLREKVLRERQLRGILDNLTEQRPALEKKVQKYAVEQASEQADVDRLENGSLAAFFYDLLGKKEEKLTKERREAREAAVRYNTAQQELALLDDKIRQTQTELDALKGVSQEYDRILIQKAEYLRSAGTEDSRKLMDLEKKCIDLSAQHKELGEAIAAGQSAMNTVNLLIRELDSAGGWGTMDLFGGGFLTDMAKYDHLNQAQAIVMDLQFRLRVFCAELDDVAIQTHISIQVDQFLQFADYFFDGLFTDWAVLDHIDRARGQAETTRSQIAVLLSRLQSADRVNRVQLEEARTQRDKLILETGA